MESMVKMELVATLYNYYKYLTSIGLIDLIWLERTNYALFAFTHEGFRCFVISMKCTHILMADEAIISPTLHRE